MNSLGGPFYNITVGSGPWTLVGSTIGADGVVYLIVEADDSRLHITSILSNSPYYADYPGTGPFGIIHRGGSRIGTDNDTFYDPDVYQRRHFYRIDAVNNIYIEVARPGSTVSVHRPVVWHFSKLGNLDELPGGGNGRFEINNFGDKKSVEEQIDDTFAFIVVADEVNTEKHPWHTDHGDGTFTQYTKADGTLFDRHFPFLPIGAVGMGGDLEAILASGHTNRMYIGDTFSSRGAAAAEDAGKAFKMSWGGDEYYDWEEAKHNGPPTAGGIGTPLHNLITFANIREGEALDTYTLLSVETGADGFPYMRIRRNSDGRSDMYMVSLDQTTEPAFNRSAGYKITYPGTNPFGLITRVGMGTPDSGNTSTFKWGHATFERRIFHHFDCGHSHHETGVHIESYVYREVVSRGNGMIVNPDRFFFSGRAIPDYNYPGIGRHINITNWDSLDVGGDVAVHFPTRVNIGDTVSLMTDQWGYIVGMDTAGNDFEFLGVVPTDRCYVQLRDLNPGSASNECYIAPAYVGGLLVGGDTRAGMTSGLPNNHGSRLLRKPVDMIGAPFTIHPNRVTDVRYDEWIQPLLKEAGDGSSGNPFEIKSRADMDFVSSLAASDPAWFGNGGHLKVVSDFDMGSYPFHPIGGSTGFVYGGVFDGNGKTISGFTNTSPGAPDVGLFARIGESGTVKDLTLAGVNITGGDGVGAIAGVSRGMISNCKVTSGSITGVDNVGGIAGRIDTASGKIAGGETGAGLTIHGRGLRIGGITGSSDHADARIENCVNNAAILLYFNDHELVGGIVGGNLGFIINSRNNGDIKDALGVSAGGDFIGGVAGMSMKELSNLINTGDIHLTGTYAGVLGSVGGIAGVAGRSLTNMLNTGNITAPNIIAVGGIAGNAYVFGGMMIDGALNTGNITGLSCVGGIVGDGQFSAIRVENRGNVTAVSGYAGGVAGSMIGSETGTTVSYAGSAGGVTIDGGTGAAGGLIGRMIGGMNGHIVRLEQSYSFSDVTGTLTVGGLVGEIRAGGMYLINPYIGNSYHALGTVSGLHTIGGAFGTIALANFRIENVAAFAAGLTGGAGTGDYNGRFHGVFTSIVTESWSGNHVSNVMTLTNIGVNNHGNAPANLTAISPNQPYSWWMNMGPGLQLTIPNWEMTSSVPGPGFTTVTAPHEFPIPTAAFRPTVPAI